MLDLNFVRDNLPLVEEKLRQRGMDPAAVLKDFREVDTQRRQAITEAETSKAQRRHAGAVGSVATTTSRGTTTC